MTKSLQNAYVIKILSILFSFAFLLFVASMNLIVAAIEDPIGNGIDTIAPAPATSVKATDTPYDAGKSITVTWEGSADDGKGRNNLAIYEILRAIAPESAFVLAGSSVAGEKNYVDNAVENWRYYYYKVRAKNASGQFRDSEISQPAKASGQWWNSSPLYIRLLLAVVVFVGLALFFILASQRGQKLYIRPLPGITAIDEAIGRATEMGRPILYICGLGTAADVATIAAFSVLGRVARKVAEYQTRVIVPCYDPVVMTVCQDVVKSAYLSAGRPEAYDSKDVYFVTQDQFPYVAAVNGVMTREKPATNFYLGMFYAESLVLAETGSISGSIQIAGTDQLIQIPFFVTACDYTLMGEELYAASAYLSQEPKQLGSIKAQDWGKALVLLLLILGVISVNLQFGWFVKLFMN